MIETENKWLIANESGSTLIEFTSYLSDDWRHDGKVLSSPIEEGGLASYNKVNMPVNGYVTFALQGTPDEAQAALTTLEKLRVDVTKFSIVSPDWEYKNLTLESFSRSRTDKDGACLLVVELFVKEVREAHTAYSSKKISQKTKNKSCTSSKATGKASGKTTSAKTEAAVAKKDSLIKAAWKALKGS